MSSKGLVLSLYRRRWRHTSRVFWSTERSAVVAEHLWKRSKQSNSGLHQMGVNDSANLDVMMLEGKRKGMVGNYHPYDDLIICVQDEKLDLEYPPMCRNFYAKQHNGELPG